VITEYLARLGLPRREPSLDYLFALHRAQVERVPYENLEIMLGRPTTVAAAESAARISAGRGGYCFHLNGAFGAVLSGLGFDVTHHVGGVHARGEDPVGATGNHLVLTVAGLPSRETPDGVWFVDAGLGDALYEPMPLVMGRHRQGGFAYRLDPSTVIPGGWHFTHAEGGSFGGMDFGPVVAGAEHFAPNHAELSGPDGHFTRLVVCQRRDGSGVDMLRDLTLTRWETTGKTVKQLETPQDWGASWADVFGIRLSAGELAELWPRAVQSHAAWLARQDAVPA